MHVGKGITADSAANGRILEDAATYMQHQKSCWRVALLAISYVTLGRSKPGFYSLLRNHSS